MDVLWTLQLAMRCGDSGIPTLLITMIIRIGAEVLLVRLIQYIFRKESHNFVNKYSCF
jgi:hypothetical protein